MGVVELCWLGSVLGRWRLEGFGLMGWVWEGGGGLRVLRRVCMEVFGRGRRPVRRGGGCHIESESVSVLAGGGVKLNLGDRLRTIRHLRDCPEGVPVIKLGTYITLFQASHVYRLCEVLSVREAT